MASYGDFVTADAVGGLTVQGAVISTGPLRLRGESGAEYECVSGSEIGVVNPPRTCVGCDLPLGSMCVACRSKWDAIMAVLDEHGMQLTPV